MKQPIEDKAGSPVRGYYENKLSNAIESLAKIPLKPIPKAVSQIVWRTPPFKPEDLPEVGDLIILAHQSHGILFGYLIEAPTTHFFLARTPLGGMVHAITIDERIQSFAVIPKPPVVSLQTEKTVDIASPSSIVVQP